MGLRTKETRFVYSNDRAFYLEAVNQQVADPKADGPSLGLILCAGLNRTVVEYALRGTAAPVAVAKYRFTAALPPALQPQLPSPAELQEVVAKTVEEVELASGPPGTDEEGTAEE